MCDGRTGLIVDDSVAAIAAAVGELLDAPDRRAAMGICGPHPMRIGIQPGPHGPAVACRPAPADRILRWNSTPWGAHAGRRASAFLRATRSRRRSSQT